MNNPLLEQNTLQARLVEFLEKDLNLIVPSLQTDLFESGGMDSVVFVELLLLIEREFGIKVDLQCVELDDFRSVSSIASFLGNQTGTVTG